MKSSNLIKQYLVKLILVSIIAGNSFSIYSQQDTIKRIIFIPHPRSENTTHQCSLPAIEKIDFSKFDMTLLGGDLAYYTTIDRVSMNHLDSIYNFGSENTLWTMGNHDLNNPALITEFTHRQRSYAYFTDKITFFVLDVEIGSTGFVSSHVTNEQVTSLQNIADTISSSRYLIVLHGRLLWMIGDEYLSTKLDSVAESTKQLDTSNFNTIVFPILKEVKKKGVQVLCLGGDKSKINIQYSPEDSITYIASTMAPEFTDEVNDVVILDQNLNTDSLTWKFVPLSEVEKKPDISELIDNELNPVMIYADNENQLIKIRLGRPCKSRLVVSLFDITGRCIKTGVYSPGFTDYNETITRKGIYILKLEMDDTIKTKKLIFDSF